MKHLWILVAVLLLAGCATGAGLEIHRDTAVEMTEMETFHILPNRFRSPVAPRSVAAAKREIERAIEDALSGKGYRLAADGEAADFDVEYVMYVTERFQEEVHDRYVFDEKVHLLGGAESHLENPIREGALHIHLLKNGEPFYEAIATEVIETGTPSGKRIRATVLAMLSDLP